MRHAGPRDSTRSPVVHENSCPWREYGTQVALHGLTLRVGAGEILGFLGPNGAGKSTTVKILTGMLKPDRGRAVVAGYDVSRDPIEVKKRIGYVPESADGPAAWLLTLTGCLGLAGMNGARTAIAINNLYSTDATLGVVWPAVVRRALHQPTAQAARDVIATSPI